MASDALVITGPTATGKTAVGVEVAARLGGEIISMDSRQVYRGMDVGTAKPSRAERQRVPHHGLDLVDLDERYSAGRFARDARRWIEEIRERGHVPILVGGTGFFLRSLLQPLFAEPPLPQPQRRRLERWLADLPSDRLAAWARVLDPERSATVHDRQRLARIVEVALLTGHPLSWWHQHAAPAAPALDALVIVLERPRAELYARINSRVEEMFAQGLVPEVRGLLERGYGTDAPGMNATGYIELVPYLRGQRDLDQAKTMIRNATRAYARRQLTWLRNQLPAGAIRVDARDGVAAIADRVLEEWKGHGA